MSSNPKVSLSPGDLGPKGKTAHVIYGQTDSTFLHIPDATAAEAVAIGHTAAKLVTAAFRPEISIKVERVMQPFLLLHVNRYAGEILLPPCYHANTLNDQSVPYLIAKIFELCTDTYSLLCRDEGKVYLADVCTNSQPRSRHQKVLSFSFGGTEVTVESNMCSMHIMSGARQGTPRSALVSHVEWWCLSGCQGRSFDSEEEAAGGEGQLLVKGLKSTWRMAPLILRSTMSAALRRILMHSDVPVSL